MSHLTWKIGDVRITRIVETDVGFLMPYLIPQSTPEQLLSISWLQPHFIHPDGQFKADVQAFVIETPDRRILVDTCVGEGRSRPQIAPWDKMQSRFLSDLEAAGFHRDSIDTVLCTHLHVDHVGWNTMWRDGKWVPTFSRARYLMARSEFEFWQGPGQDDNELQTLVFADSVEPVFEAGLVDLVETDHKVCDQVRFIPTYGHTPAHVSVLISSKGEEALITGDAIHHPCQIARPEWTTRGDTDQAMAHHTRQDLLERVAGSPLLMIGSHFPAPVAGRIVRDGTTFRFDC